MMASASRKLSDSINEFNIAMYRQSTADNPSENAFLSPSNVAIVMLMVYIGSRNRSEEQMIKGLKLEEINKQLILDSVQKIVETLEKGSKYTTIKTANCLFPHSDRRILDTFISSVKEYFHTDVKPMEFTKFPEESRVEINKWVENNTESKIKEILPEGSLTPLTALVIVNTIYFKGSWEFPFKTKNTELKSFTKLNGDKIKVSMMRAKKMEDVYYGRNRALNCKVLKLRYEDKRIGMLIVLPNEIDGLPMLESKLDLETLRSLQMELSKSDVEVSLPKFKLEASIKLKPLLSKLGMVDIFDEDKADLSGTGKDLYVSEVYHKTFIEVNEEGTEAGAATSAVEESRSLDKDAVFNADHPFMFIIWHEGLNFPLFIGRLVTPDVGDEEASHHRSHHRDSDKRHHRRRHGSDSRERYSRRRHVYCPDEDRHKHRKRRR